MRSMKSSLPQPTLLRTPRLVPGLTVGKLHTVVRSWSVGSASIRSTRASSLPAALAENKASDRGYLFCEKGANTLIEVTKRF